MVKKFYVRWVSSPDWTNHLMAQSKEEAEATLKHKKFAYPDIKHWVEPCKMIILRGVSGSGKSTLAKSLEKEYRVRSFSTDEFFMVNGRYVWNPSQLSKNHTKNLARSIKAMDDGQPVVIVDNTNTRAWEMKPYAQAAVEHGYEVEILEPSWDTRLKDENGLWNIDFLEELQKTKESLGKNIPRHKLIEMRDRYEYNLSLEDILR